MDKDINYSKILKIDGGFIFNINKPKSWSSFDVVRKIRKITSIKKVGHAGTLDPFATGVLIILAGRATKLSDKLMNLPKEYEAEILLGKTTDTLDDTGTICGTEPVPDLNSQRIIQTLESFRGIIRQRIPEYSAAKIEGRRSYKLARKGLEVPERYKTVHIYEIKLNDFHENILNITVSCGRGTYIRSLGLDIARKLGTTGYLTALQRTRIGDYKIKQALTPEEFENEWITKTGNEDILFSG
ncbi:MAG: tRNA pseudouridine(55) synthase TruB [Calditrichaeota bacterium]|nr:tRNA pseudouridine(55) synthase TruB [Calditrichota bacterium]